MCYHNVGDYCKNFQHMCQIFNICAPVHICCKLPPTLQYHIAIMYVCDDTGFTKTDPNHTRSEIHFTTKH